MVRWIVQQSWKQLNVADACRLIVIGLAGGTVISECFVGTKYLFSSFKPDGWSVNLAYNKVSVARQANSMPGEWNGKIKVDAVSPSILPIIWERAEDERGGSLVGPNGKACQTSAIKSWEGIYCSHMEHTLILSCRVGITGGCAYGNTKLFRNEMGG